MDVAMLICILVAVTLGYIWWQTNRKKNLPPGPLYLWPHNIQHMLKKPKEHVKLGEKHGGICTLPIYTKNLILLTSWESMKEAFLTNSAFGDKPRIMFNLDKETEDKEMLTASGPLNKEKRRFVIYHLHNLGFGKSSMENIMAREISRLIDMLDERDNQEVEITKIFHMPILNILWGITAGKSFDYDDETMKEYLRFLGDKFYLVLKAHPVKVFPLLRYLPGDPFDFWKLYQKLTTEIKYFDREVEKHVSSFQRNNLRDFVDIYLAEIFKQSESDNPKETCFTTIHLKGALFSLFNAGLETTSTTLEWAILYFVTWPVIQEKIQLELDDVIGGHRKPSVQDRPLMPFTEAAIMEIQRFSTVVPTTIHKASRDTKLMGYAIPKGTEMIRSIYAIHHDKALWGDPEIFRPERFINEEGKISKPEYFIPFSNGSRQCIAEQMVRMELFLFIASLLQHFTFSYSTVEKPPSLEPIYSVIANPPDYSVVVKRRMC